MSFDRNDYLVPPGKSFSLAAFDPGDKRGLPTEKAQRKAYVEALSPTLGALQEKLHAEGRRKFLVVLQGMDTAGKDGTIRRVFQSVNPLGIRVHAFKAPTEHEAAHDFLWRVHQVVPGAGEMVLFNRSHYEDVLIQKVRGWIDAKTETRRFAQIRDFERLLAESGTTIVKFFLHLSRDEQRERLQERIERADKHWKFRLGDLETRRRWDAYQAQYERVLAHTSSDHAPWFVIPADSKSSRDCVVITLLIDILEAMDIRYPEVDTSGWPKMIS